jgi:hypothetical protein
MKAALEVGLTPFSQKSVLKNIRLLISESLFSLSGDSREACTLFVAFI